MNSNKTSIITIAMKQVFHGMYKWRSVLATKIDTLQLYVQYICVDVRYPGDWGDLIYLSGFLE